MVPARDTAAGVAAGAGTSGETVFRRGAGAGGAARVDPLLRRISGLTRFDRVSCGRWLGIPIYRSRSRSRLDLDLVQLQLQR